MCRPKDGDSCGYFLLGSMSLASIVQLRVGESAARNVETEV